MQRRCASVVAFLAGVLLMVSFATAGQGADSQGWVSLEAPVVKPGNPVKPVVATVKPPQAPPGATFRCRDGTYSFVSKPALACWGHGGVAARV
jgi:hypothetical protein